MPAVHEWQAEDATPSERRAAAANPRGGGVVKQTTQYIDLTDIDPEDINTTNIKTRNIDQINNNNPTEDSCDCGWAEPDMPVEVHERYHQAEARLRELYQLPAARHSTATTASMLKHLTRACTSAQLGIIFDAAGAEKDRSSGRPPNQQHLRTTMNNLLAGTSPPARQRDISRGHTTTPPSERSKSRWQADVITVQDIIAGGIATARQ